MEQKSAIKAYLHIISKYNPLFKANIYSFIKRGHDSNAHRLFDYQEGLGFTNETS